MSPPATVPDTGLKQMLSKAKAVQKKPDLASLRKQGYTPVDMHVHTRYSDSFTPVRKIVKKARRLGIGVSITDHNQIHGCLRAMELAPELLIIPGIEISTAEGPHLLVYFYRTKDLEQFYAHHVKPEKNQNPHSTTNLTIPEILDRSRPYRGLVCIAHPYSPAYTHVPINIRRGFVPGRLLDEADAMEVINGAMTRNMNNSATELASHMNIPICGGSDSHSLGELGTTVTGVRADTVKKFLKGIRERRSVVYGRPIGQVKRVPTMAKVSQKHAVHLFPNFPGFYENLIRRPMRIKTSSFKTQFTPAINSLKVEGLDMLRRPQKLPKKASKIRVIYKPVKVAIDNKIIRSLRGRCESEKSLLYYR